MSEYANKIFTPKELQAVWEMPCNIAVRVQDLAKAYEFHVHCSGLPDNPEKKRDHDTAELIVRALLADQENPQPAELP